MDWKTSYANDQGFIKVPKRWLHIHYYEALNILFRFENSLRVFVYAILKKEYLGEWKNCCFSIGDSDPKTINGIASQRIRQAENFGYLGFDITSPVMHLTSGELVELIVSESYWPKFKPYFKGNKEIIKNKLLEIGNIRNSLAHFRPIKPDDIGLVKQNSRHTLIGVESCLQNLFNQGIRVPTNTPDPWYIELSTIGSEFITNTPYYSENELWVCLNLKFKSPQLEQRQFGQSFYSYTMGKVITPNILSAHPDLAKLVTYVSENVNYPTLSQSFRLEISKDIRLVFSKDTLITHYAAIAVQLKEVVAKIGEECELLLKDNLARGQIVEATTAMAWMVEEEGSRPQWKYSYNKIAQEYAPHHPDEYWGKLEISSDVVAGTQRYPWMPTDISLAEDWQD